MSGALLRGITWNHSRGLTPLVATAQRFHELHPSVEIIWEKRSLQQFGDVPIEKLAALFDLLVIDHPFAGTAAATGVLLPLDEHLPREFLADQAAQSVGQSHASYFYGGHQWALAIDAATPVAAWRADLLERHGATVPADWTELLALAERGLVTMPALAVDALMNLYPLILARGEIPFQHSGRFVSEAAGLSALEDLRAVIRRCEPSCFERNPILTWEALAAAGDNGPAYCPLAYAYSNYARTGYAAHRLQFGPPPRGIDGVRLRTTLGGTGLAIAARCRQREAALAYAQFTAAGETQRTLYTAAGGQPGHRSAWLDAMNNSVTGDFFSRLLPALDEAYLRPRYHGYLYFQDMGGPALLPFLRGVQTAGEALANLERLYLQSRERG